MEARQLSLRAPRGTFPAGAVAEGAKALADWVDARAGDYEVVAQRRDADGPMVDRALEIVRTFIADRGLVLFGGFAIDCALRLKGARIYPDDQRPDFDFLSPRSVDDAYDLAEILRDAGFESGAVRGIHVQTMRVRANSVWVADVGYAPPEVFAKLPTFEYRGLRVVHPDFQRIDMHLAFCFPFNGPPREDVFHRWRKDLKRLNLFEQHYPVAQAGGAAPPGRLTTGRLAVPATAARSGELLVALHGFAAYAAIRAALDELAAALGARPPVVAAPRLRLEFPDERSVAVELPAGDAVVVASPWPAEAVEGLGADRFYPFMDAYPESYRAAGVTVLSTKGRLLAASLVRAGGGQAYVVSPQYLLLWLLLEAVRAEDPGARATYRAYYGHTLEVLRAAEGLYCDVIDAAPIGAAVRAAAAASFSTSPFALMLTTIGAVNHDNAYIVKMAGIANRLRDTPPAMLALDPDIAGILEGLPVNYYPATAKHRPAFDYGASPLFRRAGQKYGPAAQ